jgi:hypothetical protein
MSMRPGSTGNADIVRLDTFILVQSRDIAIVCEFQVVFVTSSIDKINVVLIGCLFSCLHINNHALSVKLYIVVFGHLYV